jgi:hypothetical protein
MIFTAGNQPAPRACLGSGAVGTSAQSATVLILVEDLEADAPNTLLFDATRKVVDKLSPNDAVGVDFGTESGHLMVPVQGVGDRAALAKAVQKAETVGIGDPYSYDSALSYAARALAGVSGVKEVIILGDGDAYPPSAATMKLLLSEGATVSSIYEGNSGGASAATMRQIATMGHGTYQDAGKANDAPRVLLKAVC